MRGEMKEEEEKRKGEEQAAGNCKGGTAEGTDSEGGEG